MRRSIAAIASYGPAVTPAPPDAVELVLEGVVAVGPALTPVPVPVGVPLGAVELAVLGVFAPVVDDGVVPAVVVPVV
jgi:hypothetical protein